MLISGQVFTAGFVAEQIYGISPRLDEVSIYSDVTTLAIADGGVGQHVKTITHGQIFIILK